MKETYQQISGHYGDQCGTNGRSPPEYLTAASYYGSAKVTVKPTKILHHEDDVQTDMDVADEKPDAKQLRLKSEMAGCCDGQTPGSQPQDDTMTIKSEMHSTGSCRSVTPPCNRRTPMTMSSYDHCHDSNSSSMSSSIDAMSHHQQQQQQQIQQQQQHGAGGMSAPSPHQQQQHGSSGSYIMMDNNARLQHRPYEPQQQINGGGGGGPQQQQQQQDMYNRSAAAAAAAATVTADRNYALTNINRPSPSYSTEVTRSSYDHVRPPSYPNPLNAAVAAAAAAYADRYESDQSCQRYASEYGDASASAAAAAMYQPHHMIMKPEQPVQMDDTIEPPLYPR